MTTSPVIVIDIGSAVDATPTVELYPTSATSEIVKGGFGRWLIRVTYASEGVVQGKVSYAVSGAASFVNFSVSFISDSAQVALDSVLTEIGTIKAKTELIRPATVYTLNRISGSGVNYDIDAFVGEAQLITIPTADYTGTEVEVLIQELKTLRDIAHVVDGSITKTSSSIAFAMPAAARSKVRVLRYSVRRVSNGEVLLYGTLNVRDAALRS